MSIVDPTCTCSAATVKAIINEAKTHQWEHKNPYVLSPGEVEERLADKHRRVQEAAARTKGLEDLSKAMEAMPMGVQNTSRRTFTREEVLLVLRAMLASKGGLTEAITAFERME